MFNSDLVLDYLTTGENNIKEIEFRKDLYAKLFLFLRTMQAVIDTSFVLIVNLNFKKPKNYLEVFSILREGNVISEATEEKMRMFAALRSKLIFDFQETEEDEARIIVSEFGEVFRNFSSEVKKFIKNLNLIYK